MARPTYSVQDFKIACISDDVLTDEHIVAFSRMVMLASEEDAVECAEIIHKYRPNLEKRLLATLKARLKARSLDKT